MSKWVKILLGFVGVIVLGLAAVFYFTSGMVETGDAFFNAVKQKDIAKARGFLSEDFKSNTDEKALTEFLSKGSLLNFKESSWTNRQISGDRGELEGVITTDSGGSVPLKMVFVKENDAWKIYAIQKPTAGLQTQTASPAIPGKSDQVALVKQSMHDFIVSVEKKNMEHFHGTISHLWQQQFTIEKLNEAFKSVIDSGANWSVLESFEPILAAEATLDGNGVMLLTGHYPTDPNVHFEQKYIYEGVGWKLIGFSIETK
jgi:hypothetical protein